MALAYKCQDFIYAAFFAKKIIQISDVISLSISHNF
jgi:hypothetical protein